MPFTAFIANPKHIWAFRLFLTQLYVEEILHLWLACRQFKATNPALGNKNQKPTPSIAPITQTHRNLVRN